MIRFTHKSHLATRLAMLLMVLMGANTAMADNVASIADFSIAPGEQKEVSLNLDNTDKLYGIEGVVTLPEGLAFVANAYGEGAHADGARGAAIKTLNPKTGKYIVRTIGTEFTGNTGAVLKFKVVASTALAATSTITLTASVKTEDGTMAEAQTLPCTVTNAEGGSDTPGGETPADETLSLAFSPASLTMTSGEEASIEVQLTNGMALSGIEAVVKASAGLTIKEVTKSDRLSNWGYNAATGKLYSLGSISGKEGTIFTVTLKADDDFAGTATLTVSDINFTTSSAKNYEADDLQMEVSVLDGSSVGDANVVLAFASESVNLAPGRSVDVEVSMTNDVVLTGFEAQLMLPASITAKFTASDRLSSPLNYNAATGKLYTFGDISGNDGVLLTMTLTADDTFTADETVQLNNINVTTAQAKNYSPASITLTVKAQDEELYNELTAEIAKLQQKLDDAKKQIAEEDADVADDYADELDAIQQEITALQKKVDEDYAANTLDKEATENEIAKIAQEIDNVVKAADEAQKAYEEAQQAAAEAQAALDKAYAELKDEIAKLQQKLEDAVESIAKDDADVADDYADEAAAIQEAITKLGKDVDEAYAAKTLDKEAYTPQIEAISKQIDQLKSDADAAQAKYEADQERQQLLATTETLRERADKLEAQIAEEELGSPYDEQIAAIQQEITDLENHILNDEPLDKAAINKTAKEISKKMDDLETDMKKEIDMKELRDQLLAILDLLQSELDAAKDAIATDYADVADDEDVVALIDEIQDMITKTYQDVWYKWADKVLTSDYKIDEKGIRSKIAELMKLAAEKQAESGITPGDIDGNGTVDDADLDQIITALLNKDLPEAGTARFKRFDANVDGKVNIIDVLAIKNLFVYGTINPEE